MGEPVKSPSRGGANHQFTSGSEFSWFAILVKKVEIEHPYKNKGNSLNFYKNSKK